MSYSIIGFGNIGQALAKAFARKGIEVAVATRRDPKTLAATAAAIGPRVIPKTLADALKADVIFLAVRFASHSDVASALPSWQGKTRPIHSRPCSRWASCSSTSGGRSTRRRSSAR